MFIYDIIVSDQLYNNNLPTFRVKLKAIPMIAVARLGWKGKTQDAPRQCVVREGPSQRWLHKCLSKIKMC